MKPLTRINKNTWKEERCTLREHLEDGDLYEHTDRGQLEQLENTVKALKKIVLKLVDYLDATEKDHERFIEMMRE